METAFVYASEIGKALLVLAVFDLLILTFTLIQIANGVPTPHIAFWDYQIGLVAHLLGV